MTECPYHVEKFLSASDVQKICDELQITIITMAESFSDDLNLYYEGYNQHKRLHISL